VERGEDCWERKGGAKRGYGLDGRSQEQNGHKGVNEYNESKKKQREVFGEEIGNGLEGKGSPTGAEGTIIYGETVKKRGTKK